MIDYTKTNFIKIVSINAQRRQLQFLLNREVTVNYFS